MPYPLARSGSPDECRCMEDDVVEQGMKQTKPAQAMELRSLSPVLDGHVEGRKCSRWPQSLTRTPKDVARQESRSQEKRKW
jgi:hypothetical protein